MNKGDEIAILSTGIASNFALEAIENSGLRVSLYHIPCLKPLNIENISSIIQQYSKIITVEDGSVKGGFGESISSQFCGKYSGEFIHLGIPDAFITHGENQILYEECGYGPQSIKSLLNSLQN